MKTAIHKHVEPFPHLVVEDMYDRYELDLIWEELNFLTKPQKMVMGDSTTGRNGDGSLQSLSKSVYLDYVYANRDISNILTVNRKMFREDFLKPFSEISPMCRSIFQQNSDSTKIRYYENDDEYSEHVDMFNYTAITFFYREPRAFEGGDLIFPDFNYHFSCLNNSTILFPSCILHAAAPVKMNEDNVNKSYSGNGRYSMMQFLTLVG
jgi:hypothetical protein